MAGLVRCELCGEVFLTEEDLGLPERRLDRTDGPEFPPPPGFRYLKVGETTPPHHHRLVAEVAAHFRSHLITRDWTVQEQPTLSAKDALEAEGQDFDA